MDPSSPPTSSVLLAALCTLGIALAGCRASETPRPAAVPPDLGPRAEVAFAGLPRYGDLARATLTVTNAGLNPILIRALDLPGQLPDPVPWLEARPGRLREERATGAMVWRPESGGETEPVFARGFLLPAQSLEIERSVRVRGFTLDVTIRYQEIPLAEISRHIYFPDTRPRPRRHAVTFRPGGVREISDYRRLPPGSPERLAVVPHAGAWPVQVRHRTVDLQVQDPATPGEVLAGLGSAGALLSRWDGGPAWVLERPADGVVSVHLEDGGVEEFSRVELAVFDLADAALLAARDLLVATRHTGEEVSISSLPPQRLLDFLVRARDEGAAVRAGVLDPERPEREACLEVIAPPALPPHGGGAP